MFFSLCLMMSVIALIELTLQSKWNKLPGFLFRQCICFAFTFALSRYNCPSAC
jgi:hypothetical protein